MIRVSQATTGPEELEAARRALERAYFGHAEAVVTFEARLADFLGVESEQVVAVRTGTDALHLALHVAGVGRGDEVIVPSMTFVASFQAIHATGATPVACDVTPDRLLMDLDDARGLVTPRTRAVMPVHFAGEVVDPGAVRHFAREHGLRVIEDAAHALGSSSSEGPVGRAGDLVCFSFDSLKLITCGEGGAVVCRDPEEATRIRRMRLLGINRENPHVGGHQRTLAYDVTGPGWRSHMSNLNAWIGLAQLEKAPGFVARRREICRRYREGLRGLAGLATPSADYARVTPFLFVLRVRDGRRDALIEHLKEREIETAVYYPPNHLHAFFLSKRPLPVTEQAYREMLNLPLHCSLTDDQVEQVIAAVRGFYSA